MSPEKGPRRHFTHQMYNPSFTPNNYEEQWGGKAEKKIISFYKKLTSRRKTKSQ